MFTKLINFIKGSGAKKNEIIQESKTPPVSVDDFEGIEPVLKARLSNGLLPGEVVLLNWLQGNNLDASFPNYFKYTYGLDAQQSAENLLEKGFIEPAPVSEALMSLTVAQLKEILKEHKLKLSGKKVDIIDRLNNTLSENELTSYIDKTPLKLTELGSNVLEEFYYIVPAHKLNSKDGVYNVAKAIEFVSELDYKPANKDISWSLFQKSYIENCKNKLYGLARGNIVSMAEQLHKENKPKDSLLHYLRAFILDMSGMGNRALEKPNLIIVAPGIIQRVKNCINYLNLSDDQLMDLFNKAWSKARPSIPFHYLNEKECYNCLHKAMQGDEDYIMSIINKSYNKLNKEAFEEKYGMHLPYY